MSLKCGPAVSDGDRKNLYTIHIARQTREMFINRCPESTWMQIFKLCKLCITLKQLGSLMVNKFIKCDSAAAKNNMFR